MLINDIFEIAIEIEKKMAEFYREISDRYQDESISKELAELSREEIDHMNLLLRGQNYLKEAPDLFDLKENRLTELKIELNRLIRLIDNVKNNRIELIEALNDAVEMERLFEQFHLKTVVEVKEISLKKLFEALSAGDKTHAKRLVGVLKSISNLS